MTSILTNSSAMAALATLRAIDSTLQGTQSRVSSGLRIASAADNAAYWAISNTMKSDKEALGVVRDTLGLGLAKVEATYAGLSQAKDLLGKIKEKLVSAQESGVDRTKVNLEITELKSQLVTVAMSSSFSGENWLTNTDAGNAPTRKIVGSFTRDASGSVTTQTIDITGSTSVLLDKQAPGNGLLTKTYTGGGTTNYYLLTYPNGTAATGTVISISSTTTATALDEMTKAVSSMFDAVVNAAGTFGAVKSRVEGQTDFVKGLQDTLDKGVSRLVDADMNEESTRLKALQTQQQLGIQALSIANTSAQNIMQLFR